MIDMVPLQVQLQVLDEVSSVRFERVTVGAPGLHGEVVAGMQGIGVRTPIAALVALATVGLVIERHMPKVGMFVMGAKSKCVAATRWSKVTA